MKDLLLIHKSLACYMVVVECHNIDNTFLCHDIDNTHLCW